MCKPAEVKRTFISDGPCAVTARTRGNACSAFSLGEGWRQSVADFLRRWADKAEGQQTLTVTATGPTDITRGDLIDAMHHGMSAATKYLNDLWRDRQVGQEPSVGPILDRKEKAIR